LIVNLKHFEILIVSEEVIFILTVRREAFSKKKTNFSNMVVAFLSTR